MYHSTKEARDKILKEAKTIAVVGLSDKKEADKLSSIQNHARSGI
ncbi:hypothetical protein MCOL2_19334 [Listeria fleischmannii FSL S10-1203]|uniref:Uncharacterized protein n=1 Tax=Listeria fleischmannii FSL S10-1203 TaxID=1265822 RepID=W7CZR7_9LIST|nr:hypothetical protein MCOL2_19334 [Listeria fleischmannii FSL S10-1203]